jgi:biotin transporter BioY
LCAAGTASASVFTSLVAAGAPVFTPLVAAYAPLVTPLHPKRLRLGI